MKNGYIQQRRFYYCISISITVTKHLLLDPRRRLDISFAVIHGITVIIIFPLH